MKGAAHLLPLVGCEPYRARMPEQSCVARYELAQTFKDSGKGLGAGQAALANGTLRQRLRECRDCKVGKKRAAKARRRR